MGNHLYKNACKFCNKCIILIQQNNRTDNFLFLFSLKNNNHIYITRAVRVHLYVLWNYLNYEDQFLWIFHIYRLWRGIFNDILFSLWDDYSNKNWLFIFIGIYICGYRVPPWNSRPHLPLSESNNSTVWHPRLVQQSECSRALAKIPYTWNTNFVERSLCWTRLSSWCGSYISDNPKLQQVSLRGKKPTMPVLKNSVDLGQPKPNSMTYMSKELYTKEHTRL